MSQPTQNNPEAVVIDANILISICSKEPSEATARTALDTLKLRQYTGKFVHTVQPHFNLFPNRRFAILPEPESGNSGRHAHNDCAITS